MGGRAAGAIVMCNKRKAIGCLKFRLRTIMEYWSISIADFYYDFFQILYVSIRNLQSEIQNPVTPILQSCFKMITAAGAEIANNE
jgi:hypothetical protein